MKTLKQGPQASLQPAQELGREAVILGLETLDLARIHEQALATLNYRTQKTGSPSWPGFFSPRRTFPLPKRIVPRVILKLN